MIQEVKNDTKTPEYRNTDCCYIADHRNNGDVVKVKGG